ncbi:hypothetical protein ABZX90_05780 [Streptomyces sp. NPDC002935]|uniref:hypothetical protein n=1 Tax=unclassified Streptomyces TaxID=2593676 RepID=UPI003329EAA0
MRMDALPYLDEHTTVVAAGTDDLWRCLGEVLDRSGARPGATGYARLVGCADRAASGPRPFAEGSTIPGFRVAAAVPGSELVLRGRHRFSSYALIFRIEEVGPDRSRLRAESRAAFPGPAGGVYRRLVVGTGGHAKGMRRLLASVRRRAEGQDGPTAA